jgi:hypothetical protein
MNTRKHILIVLLLMIGTLMAACAPEAESSDGLPPVAAVKAREALAAELGLGIDSVTIEEYERAEWSDSCLGLGGPAESCLAAITPGWRVSLSVEGGENYEVRTDELGEIIRINQ